MASVGIRPPTNDHPHFRETVNNRRYFNMAKYKDDLHMISELLRDTFTYFDNKHMPFIDCRDLRGPDRDKIILGTLGHTSYFV